MPHSTPLLTMIVICFGLAFVLGIIAKKLRLSPIVGYLIAGVLLGPTTPGYIADQAIAHELAEIGVILLMFGVGLHFSWHELNQVKKIAICGALCQMIIATLLGWAVVVYYLKLSHESGLLFGISLSVASTVVLLRALQEHHMFSTKPGQIAVGWLLVEDLAVVIILVLLPPLAKLIQASQSLNMAPMSMLSSVLGTLFFALLKIAAFVVLMLIVGKRAIPWILKKTEQEKSPELFRLAVLAIALGMAFGSAKLFGVSFALGAFFAGMILNESEFSKKAARETIPLRDAFAVLFFVGMGMLLNPMILINKPFVVLAVVMIIVLGKSLAAYLIMLSFRYPAFTAATIAISLAQIGEFSFILAELGVKLHMISGETQDIILASALISILLNPILFNVLLKFKPEKPKDAKQISHKVSE